jgi:hypothetical protein
MHGTLWSKVDEHQSAAFVSGKKAEGRAECEMAFRIFITAYLIEAQA